MQFSEIPQRDNVTNIEAGWFNVLKAAGIALLNKFDTIKNFLDVSNNEPLDGQALIFNGTEYEPRSLSSNGLKVLGGGSFLYDISKGFTQSSTANNVAIRNEPAEYKMIYQSFLAESGHDVDYFCYYAKCKEDNSNLTGTITASLYTTTYNSSALSYEPDTKVLDFGVYNVSNLLPASEGYTKIEYNDLGVTLTEGNYYAIVIETTQENDIADSGIEFVYLGANSSVASFNGHLERIKSSTDGISWAGTDNRTLAFTIISNNKLTFSENFQIEKAGVQNSLNEILTAQSPFKFPDTNVVYISKLKSVAGDTAPTLNHAPIESVPSDAIVFARKDSSDLIIADTRFEPNESKKLYSHGASHDEVSSKTFSLPDSATTEIENLIFDSNTYLSARVEYLLTTATKTDRGSFEVIFNGTNWQLIEGMKKLDDSGITFSIDSTTGQISATTSTESASLRYRVERL